MYSLPREEYILLVPSLYLSIFLLQLTTTAIYLSTTTAI